MRRFLGPAIAIVVVLGAMFAVQQLQQERGGSWEAPDFTLSDLDGKTVRLGDLRGQVVFLNLWATWCPPCRAEMPSMETLYQRFRGRGFAMLAVAEDSDGATSVAPFVAELGLTFPILLDTENLLPPRYGVTGYPETFIIDREGRVVKHVIGPENWARPEMIAYVDGLLQAPPAAP